VDDVEQDGGRYLYWAYFGGGDPKRPRRVTFRIPGHGHGFYLRHEGDRAKGLLRYDRWAAAFPRGASLDRDGRWRASESPERNVRLGSDYGEPVTADEARRAVVELGHPPETLDEPTVIDPDDRRS
jgi:hypothetical protein